MQLTVNDINTKIYTIRDTKVMLDSDLAQLYEVETKTLNRVVKRNLKRFPVDFMFQLSDDELENLRCQIGTFNHSLKNRKYNPYVFTEQGLSMLSGLLNSDIAININIQIMRTFVEMRRYALTHDELAKQIASLDARVSKGAMPLS